MNSKVQSFILVLAGILALIPRASGTSFKYNNDTTCSSPVDFSVDTWACNGGSVCGFGSTLAATGSFSSTQDIPELACITLKSCFMGITFICRSFTNLNIDLCTDMNLQSTDGNTQCPSAGSYSFTGDFTIPELTARNLGSGWWVTTYVTVNDCSSGSTFTSCKGSLSAVKSTGSTSTAAFMGYSAVGAVFLIGFYYARQRRAPRIDLLREEQYLSDVDRDTSAGHFEMMNDGGVRV